ncbi:MAG: patatin-like phospholipase family protein [Spirochaetales bacterium]
MPKKKRGRRIGLALAAGGAKGVAYIPFLAALEEMGVHPAVVAGSSVGSVIGGLYAAGCTPADITDIVKRFKPRRMGEFFRINWSGPGIITSSSVRRFLSDTLPVTTFAQTRVPFVTVATDYWRRDQVVFRTGSLIDAITASAAVPGLFEPARVDGRILIDGGITNTLPYDLIDSECDAVIALDVSNRTENPDRDDMPRGAEMVLNTFRILTDRQTEEKVAHDPPAMHFRLKVPFVEVLDFHKYEEIFDKVWPEVDRFRDEVSKLL